MDDNNYKPEHRGRSGRIASGLFILLIGGVLLLDQMGVPLPGWLFSWHVLMIAAGLFMGFRHNFRGGGWLILVAVGGFFLIQDYFPEIPIRRFFWPCILILAGMMIIISPRRHRWRKNWPEQWGAEHIRNQSRNTQAFARSKENFSSEDFIDSTAIFGGVHRKIVSKTFKGGDITTIMGGTEIDLSQADFSGTIHMDVTQIMGGTKIILPPHWEVRSEITAVFAGFEDKRQQPSIHNPEKVLILDGTSFFGGIELKNF